MRAKDIMTKPVVTVSLDTHVRVIAALLVDRHISGVPVVEDFEVVGMVSEGDLLHRHEIGTDGSFPGVPWWKRLMKGDQLSAEYVKSHGRQARHVMTAGVVSVREVTPVGEIASLFEEHRIKRVPVLRDGHLVGIVSRSDLVHALVEHVEKSSAPNGHSDEAIRVWLLAELAQQPWWRSDWSAVSVQDGVVRYSGMHRGDDERRAARVAAENVPGVRGVRDDRFDAQEWAPMV